ncbi:MAG: hypothetical protein OSA99_05025 [Acidimicrobiales bacterium]|nr:hypothetical protein [Acidimicrobiales bacterium]
MNKAGRALLVAVVVVGAGWVALLALDGDDDRTLGKDVDTAVGVCDAARASADVAEARAVFFDLAHHGLHDLADRASDVDRAVAGELLRDKEQVEGLLDGSASPEQLRLALEHLHESTVAAAIAVGSPNPKECS